MRKRFLTFSVLAVTLVLLGCRPHSVPSPEESESDAPHPSARPTPLMSTLEGDLVALDKYHGRVILLDVWASWCPPCLEALPELEALHGKYRKKGFSVVGVSVDAAGASVVRPLIVRHKVRYPMLLDSRGKESVKEMLDVTTLPTLFLLNAKGVIVGRWAGRANNNEIETAIINALDTSKPRD